MNIELEQHSSSNIRICFRNEWESFREKDDTFSNPTINIIWYDKSLVRFTIFFLFFFCLRNKILCLLNEMGKDQEKSCCK